MLENIIPLDVNWLDLWENGQWFEATYRPYIELLGRPAVALLLGAPLTLALWIQTESLTVPGTLLALFLGLMLSNAPPSAAIVGYLIVVIAVMLAYRSISGVGRP